MCYLGTLGCDSALYDCTRVVYFLLYSHFMDLIIRDQLHTDGLANFILATSTAESETVIFQRVVHAIKVLLPVKMASVALLNSPAGVFDVVALEGIGKDLPVERQIANANTLLAECVRRSKIVGWRRQPPPYSEQELLLRVGMQTSWSAPMLSADQGILGTVNIASQDASAFDESELVLLAQIAALAGSFIEKVRLVQRLRQQVNVQSNYLQRLDTLRSIEVELSLAVTEKAVFDIIANTLCQLVPAKRISFLVPSANGESAVIYALNGSQANGLQAGVEIPLLDEVFGKQFVDNKPIYIPDMSRVSGPTYTKLLRSGLRSSLNVGIFVRDKVIGCLNLAVERVDGFEPEDQALIAALSAFMSSTLERIHIQQESSRQLAYQATHDNLTGLSNRVECEQRLATAIADYRRSGIEACFCFIDIDYFKLVNDTYGHQVGDKVLRHVASCIRAEVSGEDLLARFGGDEFALLIYNCSLAIGCRIAERIRRTVAETPLLVGTDSIGVTLSIGITSVRSISVESGVNDLIANADVACYSAKEQGRDRVAKESIDDEQQRFHRAVPNRLGRLRSALQNDAFVLFAQPIVCSSAPENRQCYEILLRMVDNQGQLIAPGAFIPVAERFGMAHRVDRWVLEALIQMITKDHIIPAETKFFVNLSAQSLGVAGFLERLVTLLKESEIAPERLCFELTETAAVSNLEEACYFIESVKALGCQFALDDFGSGLSSLNYLKHLPVDYLKIDGALIRDINRDPVDLALIQAIQAMASALSLCTIAEHVEDANATAKLRTLGVDFLQGYGIEKPQALADIFTRRGKDLLGREVLEAR